MRLRKFVIVLIYLVLVGVGVSATIYFHIKGRVEVFDSNIKVSPQSFSVDVAKGVEYVKSLTVKNYGQQTCVYFEDVVEGPTPEKVDLSYKNAQGSSIYSAKKLCLEGGSAENPYVTKVNVHINVKEEAETGKYTVYVFVRS